MPGVGGGSHPTDPGTVLCWEGIPRQSRASTNGWFTRKRVWLQWAGIGRISILARVKHIAGLFLIALLAVVLWMTVAPEGASAHNGVDDGHPNVVTQSGGCGEGLTQARPSGGCTHGPDPAPPGVTPGIPDEPEPYTEASYAVCDGNGSSGKRVQVLYVHASDVESKYDEYLSSFQAWAAKGDSVYQRSAAQTGGMRYLRFVQNSSCVINVREVTVSASGDDDFWSVTDELWNLGYRDVNRKYLVFLDNDHPDFCGQADVYHDDTDWQGNTNNSTYGFWSFTAVVGRAGSRLRTNSGTTLVRCRPRHPIRASGITATTSGTSCVTTMALRMKLTFTCEGRG